MRAELGLPSVRGDEERGGGMMGKPPSVPSLTYLTPADVTG